MCHIPISEFWNMTPWQLSVAIDGLNETLGNEFKRGCWLIWHQSAMTRSSGEMISLSKLMGEDKTEKVQVIDEMAILGMLKRQAERFKNDSSNG